MFNLSLACLIFISCDKNSYYYFVHASVCTPCSSKLYEHAYFTLFSSIFSYRDHQQSSYLHWHIYTGTRCVMWHDFYTYGKEKKAFRWCLCLSLAVAGDAGTDSVAGSAEQRWNLPLSTGWSLSWCSLTLSPYPLNTTTNLSGSPKYKVHKCTTTDKWVY